MKKYHIQLLILLFLFFGLQVVSAQNAVATTGGDATGSGGSASYTVGQIVYTTATGSNGSASQGVQQPYEFYIVGIDGNPGINLQLTVYPNPTQSRVTLNIGNLDPEGMMFQLYDTKGKLIETRKIQGELTALPMENLTSGTYLLKVINGKTECRTFKIIKN